jgi:predicted phosphoribosyltransferase
MADRLVCPAQPEPFRAVSLWYREFPQTSDDEVRRLLAGGVRTDAVAFGLPSDTAA